MLGMKEGTKVSVSGNNQGGPHTFSERALVSFATIITWLSNSRGSRRVVSFFGVLDLVLVMSLFLVGSSISKREVPHLV